MTDFTKHMGTGTFNLNSNSGPILPWLRTIDAFDTHDDSIQLVIAGGVTSVQALPGTINAIGERCSSVAGSVHL